MTIINKEKLMQLLKENEQSNYDGGNGETWLAEVGEHFIWYVEECAKYDKRLSINGFIKYLEENNMLQHNLEVEIQEYMWHIHD